MSQWSSTKARRVLAALLRIGWSIKRETGSHKILEREGWENYVFAFHDGDEIGPQRQVCSQRIYKHNRSGCKESYGSSEFLVNFE